MEEKEEVVLKKPTRKYPWMVLLVGVFVFIFAFLFYTSFVNPEFGSSLITGNVIKETVVNGIPIQANLDSPSSLSINSAIDKVEMRVNGQFTIDGKTYDLESASIVIDNFNGKINFNSDKVVVDGKATKIFVEGIPISGKISVKFDNSYDYLNLRNVHINSISYDASGTVKLQDGKVSVTLRKEPFNVRNFIGDLEKKGNSFKLSGLAGEIKAGLINIKAEEDKAE